MQIQKWHLPEAINKPFPKLPCWLAARLAQLCSMDSFHLPQEVQTQAQVTTSSLFLKPPANTLPDMQVYEIRWQICLNLHPNNLCDPVQPSKRFRKWKKH